jgi:hypothetical protein
MFLYLKGASDICGAAPDLGVPLSLTVLEAALTPRPPTITLVTPLSCAILSIRIAMIDHVVPICGVTSPSESCLAPATTNRRLNLIIKPDRL